MHHKMTRRGFLVGCSSAIAGLAGSRFNTVAFGAPAPSQEILVVLFLRGGMDGLSLVPPIAVETPHAGDDHEQYLSARPTLAVPASGPGAALDLGAQMGGTWFGLHPAAEPLLPLYQDGRLAIVEAVGMQDLVNKSHFDAMQFVENGTPGSKGTTTGWITRHLESVSSPAGDPVMPSLALGDLQPTSLLGSTTTVNLADPESFSIDNGPWLWRNAQRTTLRELYQGASSWLHDAGVQALNAVDIVELNVSGDYTPSNGADYPQGELGDHLQVLAQMIKLDLGLQVATLDFGGWDTHDNQGEGGEGYFASLVNELSRGLDAFYTDLDGSGDANYTQRLTLVLQSEFGRELLQNADQGTEHGYGNLLMVLSGNAIGGLHGEWPGLETGQLVDGTDLAVTTDYRRVLSEILIRRLSNPRLDLVFPGYTGYSPLGIVQGEDLPVGSIFTDGFESGDTSAWSS